MRTMGLFALFFASCGDDGQADGDADADTDTDTGSDADTDSDTGDRSIVPEDLRPPPGTWESAGVEGGIPERNTICAVVTDPPYGADPTGAVSAVSAIQASIDGCPEGQVVSVPAGTYLLDGALDLD